MNQIFDLSRAKLLANLNFATSKKVLLYTMAGFFGFVFTTSFFVAKNIPDSLEAMHMIFFTLMLLGGVIFVAGRSYSQMNNIEKAISYLSIPASTFEKYVVPIVFTTIGWILATFLTYHIFAILINVIWSVVFQFEYSGFNFFTFNLSGLNTNWEFLKIFFLIHSIFFLGSAAFKKNPIPKTLLTAFIVNSFFTFFGMLLVFIFFGTFENLGEVMTHIIFKEIWIFQEQVMSKIMEITFVYILPVIFYITAFFKLKEREV